MSAPLRQRLTFASNWTPQGALIRSHFSFQIPGRRPAPSPTFLRLSLPFSTGASLSTFRLCIRLRTVHVVVAEECRVLESVNYEVVTYTRACSVCLFEARFSLRVQHLRQRSPQVTGSCCHCSRAFPLVFWRALPCASPITMSGTAHSPWTPRQVASGALFGSSRAWSWFASCKLGFIEGKATLVRSASLGALMHLSLAPLQNVRIRKLLL